MKSLLLATVAVLALSGSAHACAFVSPCPDDPAAAARADMDAAHEMNREDRDYSNGYDAARSGGAPSGLSIDSQRGYSDGQSRFLPSPPNGGYTGSYYLGSLSR
jgi:opacity protein-like surface antigen